MTWKSSVQSKAFLYTILMRSKPSHTVYSHSSNLKAFMNGVDDSHV